MGFTLLALVLTLWFIYMMALQAWIRPGQVVWSGHQYGALIAGFAVVLLWPDITWEIPWV